MGKCLFIADTHFYDENILKMEPERQGYSLEQMHNIMIKNWNDTVTEDDDVYVVGDFISTNDEIKIQTIVNALKGKIHLIVGNHDHINKEYLKEHTKVDVIDYTIILDDFWIVSHEPMYVTMASPYANIFGHVHGNPMYKTVSPRSYCVSAERIGFKPILFEKIKKEIFACN